LIVVAIVPVIMLIYSNLIPILFWLGVLGTLVSVFGVGAAAVFVGIIPL